MLLAKFLPNQFAGEIFGGLFVPVNPNAPSVAPVTTVDKAADAVTPATSSSSTTSSTGGGSLDANAMAAIMQASMQEGLARENLRHAAESSSSSSPSNERKQTDDVIHQEIRTAQTRAQSIERIESRQNEAQGWVRGLNDMTFKRSERPLGAISSSVSGPVLRTDGEAPVATMPVSGSMPEGAIGGDAPGLRLNVNGQGFLPPPTVSRLPVSRSPVAPKSKPESISPETLPTPEVAVAPESLPTTSATPVTRVTTARLPRAAPKNDSPDLPRAPSVSSGGEAPGQPIQAIGAVDVRSNSAVNAARIRRYQAENDSRGGSSASTEAESPTQEASEPGEATPPLMPQTVEAARREQGVDERSSTDDLSPDLLPIDENDENAKESAKALDPRQARAALRNRAASPPKNAADRTIAEVLATKKQQDTEALKAALAAGPQSVDRMLAQMQEEQSAGDVSHDEVMSFVQDLDDAGANAAKYTRGTTGAKVFGSKQSRGTGTQSSGDELVGVETDPGVVTAENPTTTTSSAEYRARRRGDPGMAQLANEFRALRNDLKESLDNNTTAVREVLVAMLKDRGAPPPAAVASGPRINPVRTYDPNNPTAFRSSPERSNQMYAQRFEATKPLKDSYDLLSSGTAQSRQGEVLSSEQQIALSNTAVPTTIKNERNPAADSDEWVANNTSRRA